MSIKIRDLLSRFVSAYERRTAAYERDVDGAETARVRARADEVEHARCLREMAAAQTRVAAAHEKAAMPAQDTRSLDEARSEAAQEMVTALLEEDGSR